MPVKTEHPSAKRQIQQGAVVVGKNGLPIDTITTIDVVQPLLSGVSTAVTYSVPTVTVDAGVNLSVLINFVVRIPFKSSSIPIYI